MKSATKSETGRTLWCGPYAMATVSGQPYDAVYKKMLRAENRGRPAYLGKRKFLTGVSTDLMETVSRTLKTGILFEHVLGKPTVNQYLDHLRPNRIYILEVTRHYIVIDTGDGTAIDNQSGKWQPFSEFKQMRKRVRKCAEVGRHKI